MQLRQSAFACIVHLYLRSTVRENLQLPPPLKLESGIPLLPSARRIRRSSPIFPLPTFVSVQEITNEETPLSRSPIRLENANLPSLIARSARNEKPPRKLPLSTFRSERDSRGLHACM